MYPYLPALTGAREVRVPLEESDTHDLDAMAAEVTAATQLLLVCNPNNPTGTHVPAAEVAAFCARLPAHVTVILDEAYIEFQTHDDPDTTVDLLAELPNLVVLRTFSKCYGLAGLRVGYALGSPKFRAAVDAVRQPFSVNALAQAAGAEAILHSDDVARRVEATIAERIRVEEGLHELGLATADTHANFSWIDLGDAAEADVVAGLAERRIAVRPGTPLGDPGHIRVSYGTAEENGRFLAALGEILD
jgi:histidinol-phosphate aminotransferase